MPSGAREVREGEQVLSSAGCRYYIFPLVEDTNNLDGSLRNPVEYHVWINHD
jgi:hypothetical protein